MKMLALLVILFIIIQSYSISTSQFHVKRMTISIQDKTILNFSPHPAHKKLKDIIEPAKKELHKGDEHNLILHPDHDIEADIFENQNVIFEVEGEPQVIASLTEKMNNMQSQINDLVGEVKKLKSTNQKQNARNKKQDMVKSFDMFIQAVQDVNAELRLEQDQSIDVKIQRQLFNLRQDRNVVHYIYKQDHPSVKQYKLQILKEKWLSMPKIIRKEFDIVYCTGFYEEIKRVLLTSTTMYPITSDDMTKSLPPEEVAKEIVRVEKWWNR